MDGGCGGWAALHREIFSAIRLTRMSQKTVPINKKTSPIPYSALATPYSPHYITPTYLMF